MAEKRTLRQELTKGFLAENPVLRLVLGTCPALATSTSMVNAIGMGISASIVLICSNIVISALRRVIPSKVRIPAYVVVIASFVTMVQMLVKAFVPALDEALGVFLPLIVVNCIILGRAEAFAGKNSVAASALDGLGMGIGFTAALFAMGTVREFFGAGTLFDGAQNLLVLFGDNVLGGFNGFNVAARLPGSLVPMLILVLAPGGFFVFGMLMALSNRLAERRGKPAAELKGCESCPMAQCCSLVAKEECESNAANGKTEDKSDAANGKTEDKSAAANGKTEDKSDTAEAENGGVRV